MQKPTICWHDGSLHAFNYVLCTMHIGQLKSFSRPGGSLSAEPGIYTIQEASKQCVVVNVELNAFARSLENEDHGIEQQLFSPMQLPTNWARFFHLVCILLSCVCTFLNSLGTPSLHASAINRKLSNSF